MHFFVFRGFTAWKVNLRIQSECGKIRTRKTSLFGHFSCSVSKSDPRWIWNILKEHFEVTFCSIHEYNPYRTVALGDFNG